MDDIVCSQCRLPRDLNDWPAERTKLESRSKNAQPIVELCVRRDEVGMRGPTNHRLRAGLPSVDEVFADQGNTVDGKLIPRSYARASGFRSRLGSPRDRYC
jgi:hypothetical protein